MAFNIGIDFSLCSFARNIPPDLTFVPYQRDMASWQHGSSSLRTGMEISISILV